MSLSVVPHYHFQVLELDILSIYIHLNCVVVCTCMYANSTPYGDNMLTQKSITIIDCLKYYFIALPQLFQLKLGRTDDCITWNVRQTLL